jgi:hypothetical protein
MKKITLKVSELQESNNLPIGLSPDEVTFKFSNIEAVTYTTHNNILKSIELHFKKKGTYEISIEGE